MFLVIHQSLLAKGQFGCITSLFTVWAGFIPMLVGQNMSKYNPLLRKFHLPVKSPHVSKLIAWFQVSIWRVRAPFSAGSNPLFLGSLSIFPWLSHGFPPSPNPAATCESFPGSHLASRAPSSKNRWIVPAGYTMDTSNVGHPSFKLVKKHH